MSAFNKIAGMMGGHSLGERVAQEVLAEHRDETADYVLSREHDARIGSALRVALDVIGFTEVTDKELEAVMLAVVPEISEIIREMK